MFSLVLALSLARIDAALSSPELRGAHVGIFAVDLRSGDTLYAHEADADFVPASTFKLITGSAALAQLGPTFTFDTAVAAGGSFASGTLDGDLYLRGGGDAELLPADLDEAAAAVEAAGITHVTGSLDADTTQYSGDAWYPPGWEVDDVPYGYAAVPGALTLDLGIAHVRVLPGASQGSPARLEIGSRSDAFSFENDAVTGAQGSDDTTDLFRPWNRPTVIGVTGSYPLGAAASDDLEPAVPDPAAYALDLFRLALARHGVTVDGGPRAAATPSGARSLWQHHSKPLEQVLADCWLPSNNLLAEQLLLALGAAAGGADTRASGIASERRWLASIRIDPDTLTIADGSGLSAYDRVTPRALVSVLEEDWRTQRAAVLAALPIAGVRGTLQQVFIGTPLAENVAAKTGSSNHSRLLAGFLRPESDDPIVFALMVNDWMDAAPGAQERLDTVRAAILEAL